jgi:uncharacterized protein (DUF362 family)
MHTTSRREFLFGALAAGLALGIRPGLADSVSANRVVHTHSNYATTWDYSSGWYGDAVDPAIVDRMTDRGVMALTGTNSRADAWHSLLPAYTAGQVVAIKVNLNNASCSDNDQVIDALPQPVNSVIQGLKAIGVAESAIRVYDVTNGWHTGAMPARLATKVTSRFPAVQFHAGTGGCATSLGYSATQKVHFNVPSDRAISDRPICNALVQASYLINMPIMKKHLMAGVTLGFKNHFGSIDGCDQVHWSVDLGDNQYLPTYTGLVDLYNNTHIKNKTVLTIGDALYGARINNYGETPSVWSTFSGRSPNSLFFSKDPVAIDCVMYDFLNAEGGVPAGSDDYLKLANSAGLGSFEHWDAQHHYQTIDYRRVEVDHSFYLPQIMGTV